MSTHQYSAAPLMSYVAPWWILVWVLGLCVAYGGPGAMVLTGSMDGQIMYTLLIGIPRLGDIYTYL